jgi:hypothetical protein
LIKLDKYVVATDGNHGGSNVVPVCTDESYLHNNHSSGSSYYASKELMGKSASKGKRLIILHAITPNGPLCERDPVTNVPYDDLIWNGDVPHPKDFEKQEDNEQNTCELLWVSSSSKGDYHDNMNSEMYMKWIVEKLVPTFERLHPCKQMPLIQDNAPYHHKRGIPSLASLTKKQLLDLATKHDVEYIELPMSVERRNSMEGTDMGGKHIGLSILSDRREYALYTNPRFSIFTGTCSPPLYQLRLGTDDAQICAGTPICAGWNMYDVINEHSSRTPAVPAQMPRPPTCAFAQEPQVLRRNILYCAGTPSTMRIGDSSLVSRVCEICEKTLMSAATAYSSNDSPWDFS